ncbi:exocyst complex component 5-like [Crassostrea virginica]|uniref:Exocyst complex component 5 n=1 Tax=Crassostrea virginica TaxID=6565 RepID=A0A8B8E2F8_CRAVI|nr:exocyst complex component 5-like [Crassostrea virginica]XP_022334554.1 exocyst complex component 5-like [Crassostrea virginica]
MSFEELEQEPFNAHEFVERLAWKVIGKKAKNSYENFDPWSLHSAFEDVIKNLEERNKQIEKNIEKLEQSCKDEEKKHWQRVADLQRRNQTSYSHFQSLDERINLVATKVVHLGDQLEGVNTPRARAVEAQRLMNYLDEFMSDEPPKSAVFTDPFQLQLAADIIQKLYQIALELPANDTFDRARKKIWDKYNYVESELIVEFKNAHFDGDKRKMKKVAAVLSNFKGYGQCIETFIRESQKGAYQKPDPFDDVVPLCNRSSEMIADVFSNPESVMAKFVQNIFHGKLQNYISSKLDHLEDPEEYLIQLYQLYTRTVKLSEELSHFKMGNDSLYLTKLTKQIFAKHLEAYIKFETKYLRERCSAHLQRYYEDNNHVKKQIQSGGLVDFKRDLQAKIGTLTKANVNIGPAVENYGGETFLSQEVTISLLQEAKNAFKRCHVLSSSSDMPGNAVQVLDVLIQYLVVEHIDYAVELGLQAIPLPDARTPPQVYFFDVVGQANTLFHLFEKQFMDSLVPLVISSPRHSECLQKKRDLRDQMESKIDSGLDRTLTAITGYVKYMLGAEQKKTDFKPDDDSAMLAMVSPACSKVAKFINGIHKNIRDSLDGKNVDVVLSELGVRLHRVLFEHLQQFQYNSLGAMLVICDVNEYRKCMKEFKIPMVSDLFEKLHALCNLLVVVPENLKEVCSGESLTGLDKSVLQAFIQLRTDYKTSKIATMLK